MPPPGDPWYAQDVRDAAEVVVRVLEEAGGRELSLPEIVAAASALIAKPNAAAAAELAVFSLANEGRIQYTAWWMRLTIRR